MKKKIFGLAFCLAVSLMATPALAAETPAEEPTVDWDTAAAIGYDFSVVDEDGVEPIPEPQKIRVSIVDLGQYQDGNLTYTVNGVEMVPLRLVAEDMGYTVDWNEETQSATINGGELTYTVRIGEDGVVDNATGNVIVDYELLNTNGEEGQEDTAAYTVTTDSRAAVEVPDGEEKIEDENCGLYADGGNNDETVPEYKLVADPAVKGFGAEAQLIDGKTFVPAAMFRVLNYNYDEAGKTFTFDKVNVKKDGEVNGVGHYFVTVAD